MKIIYNKKDSGTDQSGEKGENRFSRLIKNLDTQDRGMDPEKRKRKWMYILAGFFFLYLASFLVPTPELSHQTLEPVSATHPKDADISGTDSQKSLTFEMPVDSFENILKKQIHEKLPEKK